MSKPHTQNTISRNQWLFLVFTVLAGIAILVAVALRSGPEGTEEAPQIVETSESPVLVTVYGKPVTQAEMELARIAYDNRFPDIPPASDKIVLNWLIERKLLSHLAQEMDIDDEPSIQNRMRFQKDTLLSEAASRRLQESPIPEAAIEEFYNNERIDFRGQTQVKARQIVLPDEAMAVEIIRRLNGGEAFASLALAYSTDRATREFGGDMGFLNRDMQVPVISEAVFSANEGDLLSPIQSAQGWHVIEVLQKRPRPIQTLEQRRPAIEALLRSYALKNRLDQLREDANITFPETIED